MGEAAVLGRRVRSMVAVGFDRAVLGEAAKVAVE